MGVSGKRVACALALAAVCALVAVAVAVAVAAAVGQRMGSADDAACGVQQADGSLADAAAASAAASSAGDAEAGSGLRSVTAADGTECVAGRVLLTCDGSMDEAALRECLARDGVEATGVSLVSSALEDGDVLVAVDYAGDADPVAVARAVSTCPYVSGAEPDVLFELADADGAGGADGESACAGGADGADGESACAAGAAGAAGADGADAAADSSASLSATPNDPELSRQWGLEAVNAFDAWDIAQADAQVTVAVIDTGADTDHPDLKDNLVLDYAKNVISGQTGAAAVEDANGHGTHVAGIVAAAADNGVGVAGVSFNAKVLPIKAVTSEDRLPTSAIVQALDYVVACKQDPSSPAVLRNIRVVNMSFGYNDNPSSLQAAVERVQEAGILLVAAAGNLKSGNDYYPAAYEGVVGVSGLKQGADGADPVFDESYSNYGSYVDVSAPGTGIYSTVRNGGYGEKRGTSMASPLVAGIAALAFACRMDVQPEVVASALELTAKDLGDAGWDCYYGSGMVDACAALAVVKRCGVSELSGSSRYGTAAALAKAAYPDGASVAIIVTGEGFADALSASGLAGLLDCPILLTATDALPEETVRALADLGVGKIVIVGGERAVSASVEKALAAIAGGSYRVKRVSGADRYATAEEVYVRGVAIATTMGVAGAAWGSTAIVACGANYPDALSISGFSCACAAPLFLVAGDGTAGTSSLTEQTCAALASGGFRRIIVVGGEAAVSSAVEEQLAGYVASGGEGVVRLGGESRYETSEQIAAFCLDEGFSADGACVATGSNFPDALAGGVFAAKRATVVLLADTDRYAAFRILEKPGSGAGAICCLGGAAAVPQCVRTAAQMAAIRGAAA